MSKRIIFKSRQRTVEAADKPKRQTVIRVSDEAFSVLSKISNETHMSLKDIASEIILSTEYTIEDDD